MSHLFVNWATCQVATRIQYLLFIMVLGLTHALPLQAQKTEEQIRQEISKAAQAIKTMQCQFLQTKHLKMLNHNIVSKGKMYYQQPGSLRWEYTSPYTYTFILNQDKVLLKNQQRHDVIDVNQSKFFKEIARTMMGSVVGSCLADHKSFKSTLSETHDGQWAATLIPLRKDMQQMFQKMVVHFSPRQAVATQVELIEKNGDKTVIELKNVQTNEPISADVFTVR